MIEIAELPTRERIAAFGPVVHAAAASITERIGGVAPTQMATPTQDRAQTW